MSVRERGSRYRSHLLTYFLAFSIVFITVAMVIYPKEAFDSAMTGLNLWWNVVFSSLVPFFILSEILMGLGVVNFIGVLLEPFMRPLFNVPGVGAFAMSMGLASGYPMDAVITCKFRRNQMCTEVEAERLLAFTNTADPLFMFGAVAVGMFGVPELGATIALAHYLSSFAVGLIFRFHGKNRDKQLTDSTCTKGNILVRSFRALYKQKQDDNRSFSELLGDSVKSSMNTILQIGGFIILFSVFLKIISVAGLTNFLDHAFAFILNVLGFSSNLSSALVIGLFELDLGALATSQADAPLLEKAVIVSALIAWSGLCVHGQVASIIIESGIRMGPYFAARFIHAVLAAVFTLLFMGPINTVAKVLSFPVMFNMGSTNTINFWLIRIEQAGKQVIILLGIVISLSIIIHLIRSLYFCIRR
ncbi:sporulation integral membrane protein YlbJ [Sporomusa sp.]|uniref:sporulation integral membrane protein YlbJ n=1 Tax=Sporomusa sp. TaxID=2078658 RepID=UPI002B54497D|nr:sporulation integral membrane protein YlbJ [Sporomusa sp.]HWR42702.1 sporulation integral membrane protein YlbJ [Sporomusa sp.]